MSERINQHSRPGKLRAAGQRSEAAAMSERSERINQHSRPGKLHAAGERSEAAA